MAVVYLTNTSGSPQTWPAANVPPAGTVLKVEGWGAGSGGTGGSVSFESGGAAAAYATSNYVVTPNDAANGISYTIQAGSAGTGAANSAVGPDTSWSTNNLNTIPSCVLAGTILGSPGTLPTGLTTGDFGTLVQTIVGAGYESGFPYIDLNYAGTSSNTGFQFYTGGFCTAAPSTQYTYSVYAKIIGATTGTVTWIQNLDDFNSGAFVGNIAGSSQTLTSTLTRFSVTGTMPASGANQANPNLDCVFTSGVPINFTVRIAAYQVEAAAAASFWKSTPGYVLAKGGSAPSGTTGGVGGLASACIPTTGAFNGGSGATHAQGGGGGGSAGPLGAGTSSTTGTGGTANNATVAALISSTEGGGGSTAGSGPIAGGSPGGGGAANTSGGTGSAGGHGQIRISWSDTPPPAYRASTLSPFRTGPGRGPRPLVPQPWSGDFTPVPVIPTFGAPAVRSPFQLLPGRGPRPLVPQPWRFNFPADLGAAITVTQDDQTIAAAATNLDTAVVVQAQADQTIVATASVGAEPIAARSPFRLLPGKGPRPLVPQPWRYYVQNANAVIAATQDDQTVTSTATIGAEPIASRSPFRLLPGRGPRPLVPQPWRYYVPLTNADITATQDDQTSSITATISAEPIATRSPFRLLPGRGPRPLVPNPWRGDFSVAQGSNAVIVQTQDDQTASITVTNLDTAVIVQTQDDQTASIAATNLDRATIVQTQDDQTVAATAAIGAQPVASRSPFRLLPGRGPRPLVPQPWRYYVYNANAVVAATQNDQTVSIAATNSEHVAIVQTQDDQTASITATSLDHAAINQTQDDQTSAIIATTSAEPIAARSPFRLLPGRGPRPLVPQPWRYYVPLANAAIVQTQDDQTASITAASLDHAAIVQTQDDQTASIAAANLGHAVIVQTQDDQTASLTAANLTYATIAQTQDDQTAAIAASVSAVPIAARSPFRLLPGRGPRPLVPNPWRYVVQADLHGSIVQTQDDQTISAAALLTHVADIDQNQDDQTISSTAVLLAAAAIAQTQSNQTIVSAATNRTHAAIVQTQDDQTIVATALLLVPRTAAIVQTQQDQTIHMAAGLPRAVVAQPQFLW